METPAIFSFGLSQLFGLSLFIFAIVLFSRRDYYRKVILNTKEDNPIIMLTATVGLLFGIVLIGLHGDVLMYYKLRVTILCWLIFINSLFWLMLPEKMLRLTKKIVGSRGFYAVIAFLAMLGFLLVFRGSELFILKQG